MADRLSPVALPRLPEWLPLDLQAANNMFQQGLDSSAQRERWKYTKLEQVWPGPAPAPAPEFSQTESEPAHNQALVALPSSPAWWGQRLMQTPDALHRLCRAADITVLTIEPGSHETIDLVDSSPSMILVRAGASLQLNQPGAVHSHVQDDVWLWVEEGAQVTHSRNFLSDTVEHRYSFLSVYLAENASYELHNHSRGAQLHRQDIHIDCVGRGARVGLESANWVGPKAHLDQHVVLNHMAADTTSQQRIHSIAGHQARITFNGRIHIHANCPKVSAHLNNRNLALSDQATINTKPELEIYTDDVECSHGATVGMIDADHLFYFASRGITDTAARQLLAQGFLRSVIHGPLGQAAESELLGTAGES